MTNPLIPGKDSRPDHRQGYGGLIPTKPNYPEINDPLRLEVGNQIVHIAFGMGLLIGLASAALAAMDADAALILTFAALGMVATGSGLAVILGHRGRLILSRSVILQSVVTAVACLLAGAVALTLGHSDHIGDGLLRARLIPAGRPAPPVAHDSGIAVGIGSWAIKVDSAEIVAGGDRGRRLKIVIELSNPSTSTNLSGVSLEAARLLLRDDQGNRYAKISDGPLEVATKEKGASHASLDPGEHALWAYYYEPPIERADHLDLTLHLSPLTPTHGLLFRIASDSWQSAPADGDRR